MALLQSNYCTQWNINHVSVIDGGCSELAASDQNIDFEVIENDRFESTVGIANTSQWKCALTMTAMVKPYSQIEHFQVSKVTKYALFYYSVLVLKISREFFILFLFCYCSS